MSRTVTEGGDPDLELAASHEGLGVAFVASIVVHGLLLTLPHPVLWNAPAVAIHAPDQRPPALSVQLSSLQERTTYRFEQQHFSPRSADYPAPAGTSLTASSAPPGVAPQPDYHLARALDRQVEMINGLVHVDIGPMGVDESGELLLRLIVDETGAVQYLQTLQSTLPRRLESAIVLRFFRATYRPGEIDGKPVKAEMLIIVTVGGSDLPGSDPNHQKKMPMP